MKVFCEGGRLDVKFCSFAEVRDINDPVVNSVALYSPGNGASSSPVCLGV